MVLVYAWNSEQFFTCIKFCHAEEPQDQKFKESIGFLRTHTKQALEMPHRKSVVLNCSTGLPN